MSPTDLAACEPVVTVDTAQRYYRDLVIAKWTYPHQGGPGRPPLPAETVQAVLRIALGKPRVGAPGIVRRLAAIGITVSASSVRNILRAHDVGPAPERSDESDWRTFLDAHAQQIAAIDATAVEVMQGDQLVTQRCVMARGTIPAFAARPHYYAMLGRHDEFLTMEHTVVAMAR